jgi:hypothetical protein
MARSVRIARTCAAIEPIDRRTYSSGWCSRSEAASSREISAGT